MIFLSHGGHTSNSQLYYMKETKNPKRKKKYFTVSVNGFIGIQFNAKNLLSATYCENNIYFISRG